MALTARIRIDGIAAGGDGVGRHDGMAVFVPRTAPGDQVVVNLDVKGRFARGALLAVIDPSPDRTEPPCAHYTADRCGGCQLQHLTYDAQLLVKRTIVGDAIERIGRRAVPPLVIEPSPVQWRYRSKLTLALRRRGGRWIAGLRAYDDPDHVFELRDCPITDERVITGWREVLAAAGLLPGGSALRGAIRLSEQGLSLVLEGGSSWSRSRAFAKRVPSIRAIWWQPSHGSRRLVADRRERPGPDSSFAQVNTAAAAELHAYVIGLALSYAPATVVDAYAGAGATAVPLAERGARVTAIEVDVAAARWAGDRLSPPSRAIARPVEEALPSTLPADVVLLNPPRGGVDERVARVLDDANPPPRAIVYVSCNPATLARDLGRATRYRVASMRAFDLFPQTAHVETVCELVPVAA